MKTQAQLILAHMNKYGSISPREAMEDYQITRLASRVYDLKQAGFKINPEIKKHPLTGKRYARYYLVK